MNFLARSVANAARSWLANSVEGKINYCINEMKWNYYVYC